MRLPRLSEISIALVLTLFVGCAQLGRRPDLPALSAKPCENLRAFYDYSTGLATAYGMRAALNRDAIYVAGVLLLGTVAATAGLGAAAAASLSIALISVSGTFVSGTFALINNAALADAYTTAEVAVNNALSAARNSGCISPASACDDATCSATLTALNAAVTTATNDLELARTAAAQAASAQIVQSVVATVSAAGATPSRTPTQTVTPTPSATATQTIPAP